MAAGRRGSLCPDAPDVAPELEGTPASDTGITGLGALLGLSITSRGDKGYGVRCAKVRHRAHLNLGVTLGGQVFA